MDRIKGSEDKIRGMDIIQRLFKPETVQNLNEAYSKFLEELDGQKGNPPDFELMNILNEYEALGLRYSTSYVMTRAGYYYRFVFRKKFVILLPSKNGSDVKLCKLKAGIVALKGVDEKNGDLYIANRYKFDVVERESIDDPDFSKFEEILEKLPDKMTSKVAAIKSRFLFFQ